MTEDEIFCLRYENQQEIRVLNIICSNAKGVHDAINAAFEEVKVQSTLYLRDFFCMILI